MKFTPLVLLVLVLTGCASQLPPKPLGGKGYLPEHVRHEDDLLHHDDEILVLNPPPDYVDQAKGLGLAVIDVTEMAGLGMRLYHMQLADAHHPLHIRALHGERFPGVVVDVHHHFGHHGGKADQGYTGRAAVNWRPAHRSCGAGIKIGVIDSAVATNHPAFVAKKIISRSFLLKGQREAGREHGTAVASILLGDGAWGGLMPGATLYSAAVFHKNSKGKVRSSSKSIVKAMAWMIQKKVDVINVSLGGARNTVVRAMVQAANKRGVVMVASVGNDGPFTKRKMYPAAYKSVIGIAAMDRFGRAARFSSKGDYVEFSAPGVNIWSAVPRGGKAMSGTSFSAPIVAGMAAVAMKKRGIQGVEGVRRYLKSIAQDRATAGWDKYTGWGSVSVPHPC